MLIVAACAVVVVLLGSSSPYSLELRFVNAGQLVKGNLVTIGGVKAGQVKSIRLASDNTAIVGIEITENRFKPLHRGTRAEIRISSLSSVANRAVSLSPGPDNAPPLAEGAAVPTESTTAPVEIDQIVSTLDAKTRGNLQDLIHGGAAALNGSQRDLNKTLTALNPAIGETSETLDQLLADQGALKHAVVDTAALFGTLDAERGSLDRVLVNTAAVTSALGTRTGRIRSLLTGAPRGIRALGSTFESAGRTFDELVPTARHLRPIAAPLDDTLREAGPVLVGARATLPQVNPLLPDLAATLRALPRLRDAGVPALGRVTDAGRDLVPILRRLLPYVPDAFQGVVGGFGGQVGGYYDANGAYVRIAPVVGALSAQGALALPVGQNESGASTGNVDRCPSGGAAEAEQQVSDAVVTLTGCKREQAP